MNLFDYFSDWHYFLLDPIYNDWYFKGDNNLFLYFDSYGSLKFKVNYLVYMNFPWDFFDDFNYPLHHYFIVDDLLLVFVNFHYFVDYLLNHLFDFHVHILYHLDFHKSVLDVHTLHYSFNFFHSLFDDGLGNHSFDYLGHFNNLLYNSRHNHNFLDNPFNFYNFWNFHHFLNNFLNWNFDFLNPIDILHNLN